MTNFPHARIGLAGAHAHSSGDVQRRATDIGCANLYTFPNSSSVVDATLPVTFKWDTTCNLGVDKIDLYIYSPASTTNSLVKAYQGITFSTGSYTAQLSPTWWNDTTTATLYINILKNGGQTWDTTWPQGPNFNVTYSADALYSLSTSNGVVYTSTKAGATPTGNTVFESVNATDGKKSNKGVIAAAVVVPILVLIGLAAVAFYFYRIKEKEKLKRWSQALSQHSGMEWEKGALPGDRMSSYGRPSSAYSRSGGRPSTQYGRPSTQYGRPSMNSQRPASSVMMENMAGAGAFRQQFPGAEDGTSRSSVVMADGYVRQSRISFADQPRPRLSAGDQHRPRVHSGLNNDATALAYATGSAIDDRDLTVVSPTQMDGPGPFGDAEIHRAATGTRTGRASVGRREDVKSMLRARGSVDELRDMEAIMYVTHPDDTVEALHGGEHDGEPHQTVDANGNPTVAYGPDQMLAVYAQRGKVNSPTPDLPSTPPLAITKGVASVKRFLTRKANKQPAVNVPTIEIDRSESPEMAMRDMTHLHNGTVDGHAVGSLPPPGPQH